MKLTYDSSVDALYLRVREGEIASTVELDEDIYVDIDADRQVLGVEFLASSALLSYLASHGGTLEIPERLGVSVAA